MALRQPMHSSPSVTFAFSGVRPKSPPASPSSRPPVVEGLVEKARVGMRAEEGEGVRVCEGVEAGTCCPRRPMRPKVSRLVSNLVARVVWCVC